MATVRAGTAASPGRVAVGLLLLAACNPDPPPTPPSEWQVVFEHQPGALLRVIGNNSKDVLVVGADVDGQGPIALHYDGTRWRRHRTGTTGDLWWSFPLGADDYRLVGDGGQIVRYTPSTGTFAATQAPTNDRLFGVWGSSATDLWTVGGQTARNRGVIWHDDGSGPTALSSGPSATSSAALFKAQGVGSDTVWFVGQRGVLLRKDSAGLTQFPSLTPYPLMGLHGIRTDRVYAVGGVAGGVILRFDGTSWSDESPMGIPQMIAIWAVDGDEAWAAGFNGNAFHRKDGVWTKHEPRLPTFVDLHSIWVDDQGGIWMAGGRLSLDPPTDGVLLYYGPPISKEVVE